ncbi:MAG: glutathione S-transferase family protein [Proteobacteria bacterium]|nr:glutathione S-transferase family protein [Pseudomonadota bacterium]
MILVGQYDSPFVRRVAVALHHYGLPFERRVLSVFQDFDAMLAINPLGKVPSLILPGGEVIYDSRAILEVLEGLAPADRRLTPSEPARHREMLRIEAVGLGLAEKTYERGIEFSRRSPGTQDPVWVARLERQIASALSWLEALPQAEWLVGDRMTRADLAVTVATTYVLEKLPQLYGPGDFPRLEAQRRKCEALAPFAQSPYSRAESLATGWRPENPPD